MAFPPDPFRSRDYVQQLLDALGGASQPFAAFEDSGWEDDATLPAASSSPFGGLGQPGPDPWWGLPPLGQARDDGFTLPGSGAVSDPGFVWSLPAGGGPRLYGQAAVDRRQQAAQPMASSRPRLFGTEAVARRQAQATGQTTSSGTAAAGTRDTVMRWRPLAEEMSAKYGVPTAVILASIDSESGGDPGAIGPEVPGQGRAHGLLQAMDNYWGKFGDLHDPRTNLDVVVGQLMAPAWKKYQSAAHVRAVTYGGPGAVDEQGNIKGELGDTAISGWTIAKDVQRYLPKVAAYTAALQGQTTAPATPEAAQGLQAAAIAEAQKHVGKPYLLASQANNPAANAFDCSGLVQWSYKTAGVALPRTAQEQYNATQRVTAGDVRPGDLVFFHSTYNAGTPVTHVGIALGNGQMLQAGSGGVGVVDLNTEYWKSHLHGFGRVA